MGNEKIICPLIEKEVDIIECIENRDCADGIILESSMPEKYTIKDNWKDICKNCQYHSL